MGATRRRAKPFVLVNFLAFQCLVVSHAMAQSYETHARNYYGAIAFSPSTGAYGFSSDYGSQDAAERIAISNCGKSDCLVPVWFRNACGALAVGADHAYGSGLGPDEKRAKESALQVCSEYTTGCSIQKLICTER
jgi:serine/threonine protein kinase, bacterial